MAHIPSVIALLTRLDGRPAITIENFTRYLREAGFLSEGKRGRGAAHVTPADAANLVMSLVAGDTPISGPRVVDVYGSLLRRPAPIPRGTPAVLQPLVRLPFGECLEAILGEHSAQLREELAGDGLELTLHRPVPRAELFVVDGLGRRLPVGEWIVSADRLVEGGYAREMSERTDRRTSITCTERTLFALGDVIRRETSEVAA